jgi:chemotaxis signal transduction protein
LGIPEEIPAGPPVSLEERCLVASLGDLLLAVPAVRLRELGEVPRLARLPLVPAWVRGLANLRGDVLAVVDLLPFVGAAGLPERPTNRLLVLGPAAGESWLGLLASRVHGMAVLPSGALSPASGRDPRHPLGGLLMGSFRHAAGEAAVLDVDRLMATLKEAKERM